MEPSLGEPLTTHFDVDATIDGGGDKRISWEILRSKQDALFHETALENERLAARVDELTREIAVWKDGYVKQERTAVELQQEVNRLAELSVTNPEPSGWVVCLLNGNNTNLFSTSLLRQGRTGGQGAAMILDNLLKAYSNDTDDTSPRSMTAWCTVYVDKASLLEAMASEGFSDPSRFSEFCIGFNTHNTLYSIVEVGGGGNPGSKLRESLTDFARMPHIRNVLCGDAYGDEFMDAVQALGTEGLSEKLVVLTDGKQLDWDVEATFHRAGVRVQTMSAIFRSTSILDDRHSTPPDNNHELEASFSRDEPSSPTSEIPQGRTSPVVRLMTATQQRRARRRAAEARKREVVDNTMPTNATSSRSETPLDIPMTPGGAQRASISSPAPWQPDSPLRSIASPLSSMGRKLVDPAHPMNSQNPPVCAFFYLGGSNGCKNGTSCPRAHDYTLSREQIQRFRDELAGTPCPNLRYHVSCVYGSGCFWSHNCAQGPACSKRENGKCHYNHDFEHTPEF